MSEHPSPSEAVVSDNRGASQFEIHHGDQLAGFVTYRDGGDVLGLMHTEIQPPFEHRGFATTLVRGTLDDIRARGLSLLPYCPFVLSFLKKHSEYLDLVPPSPRKAFGL